ncbi:MAG: hypothetical protein JST89_24230 [Cyanobacteria bacterium SZAS-4]|nr:hypothetical protein [Cyanobacteria bacterium SZAS-4]
MTLQKHPSQTLTAADIISGRDTAIFSRQQNVWTPKALKAIPSNESEFRGGAFATLIYGQCRGLFEQSLQGKSKIVFKSAPIAQSESALKILTCISIHLAGIEGGGAENPAWFIDFLFNALRASDARTFRPTARSVLEQYGSIKPELMSIMGARFALAELRLTDSSEFESLGKTIFESRSHRLESLKLALSGSKEKLSQVLEVNFLAKLSSLVT